MEQNTPEWLEMRKTKLGASDAPIVLKKSPWKTPIQLYEEKLGIVEQPESNYAMERGHALEPIAREHYTQHTGITAEPNVFISTTHPFIMASLDGYNEENGLVLEIKCPGAATHEKAEKGEIERHYWIQVQHQMFVAECDICHFWSFDGEKGALVTVKRDNVFINDELLPCLCEFHDMMERHEPPALTEKDYKQISDKDIPDISGILTEYAAMEIDEKAAKKRKSELKKQIFESLPHVRCAVGKTRIYVSTVKGAVQYDRIPELAGIDLDQYRKDSYDKKTISLDKELLK